MRFAHAYYGAESPVGLSVAASQHSVMTARGRSGEHLLAAEIIARHEGQILSLVADSYDYCAFVDAMIAEKRLVDQQHVRLVIRPDSVTPDLPTPEAVVLWTLNRLEQKLGCTRTATGHRVVPYGILWGDGLEASEIRRILVTVVRDGFAAHNLVFGMGGGLLQKVNRDTCRFAMKTSARQLTDGTWVPMAKEPLQADKASKAGRLQLYQRVDGHYETRPEAPTWDDAILEPVFENGVILRQQTFADVKAHATAPLPTSSVASQPQQLEEV
jgi:nicotinamide phosphoribosyltransferase